MTKRLSQPSAEEGEIMAQKKFLVTGATGHTGSYTVERLLERGHAVRALAHREDDRSKRLEKMGAEVVIGNLLKFNDVRAAMRGVRGAYFYYPIRPGILQTTAYFAQAAKEASLECVVNMSQNRLARTQRATLCAATGWQNGSSTGPASPSPTCATSAKLWNRRRRSDGSVRRKISRRGRSSSLHPIRNGSPAKHYSSREVFVRHLQKMTSTTRKEN
jgi:hypothetical protein